jgi:hypothetical protein
MSEIERPENVTISNAHDMRDILERAAIKMMQRKKSLDIH